MKLGHFNTNGFPKMMRVWGRETTFKEIRLVLGIDELNHKYLTINEAMMEMWFPFAEDVNNYKPHIHTIEPTVEHTLT